MDEIFILSQGMYSSETIIGAYTSLKQATDQFPVDTEWEQHGDTPDEWFCMIKFPTRHPAHPWHEIFSIYRQPIGQAIDLDKLVRLG